jgi:RNA polymerase sigma factor (sigma-70 family)
MGSPHLSQVIARLRSVLLKQNAAGLSDGELLSVYVRNRDEASFEELVRRHGPMVLGVCRRVLQNPHDAEDAFQATLLVLVRKACSLRSPGMVGNWLYGVAYRTAQEARKIAAKRRAKEAQVTRPSETLEDAWEGLRTVLDQELDRLPDKYRAVVVLCDLEGKTRKEAAQRLGWPEGTVASRLANARRTLAKRLSRRQSALSGGALATLISQNAAASMPATLVSSTVRAAGLIAAGTAPAGLISVQVAALTQGVLKSMLLTKLKITIAGFLLAGLTTFGVVLTHNVWSAASRTEDGPQGADKKIGDKAAQNDKAPATFRAGPPRVLAEYKKPVACLAWSPDGRSIAVATQDDTVHVAEVATGLEISSIAVNASVNGMAFSRDGKKLALSQPGNPAGIWDVASGKPQPSAGRGGGNFVPSAHVTFAPDGQTAVCIGVGQIVRAGPNSGGGMMMSNPAGGGCAATSADGAVGGWCDAKGMLRVFDLAQPAMGPQNQKVLQVDKAACIAFGPGGKLLAVGGDKGVQLWDLTEKKKTSLLTGLESPVMQLSLSADGRSLAGLANDGVSIRVWDLKSETTLCQIQHVRGAVASAVLSPDGKLLATTAKDGKQVFLWKVAARQLAQRDAPLELRPQEMGELWASLDDPDAEKADAAWRKLGAAGDNALAFLRQQIRPIAAPPFDAKPVEALVAELDSEQFVTRERAMRDLIALGELAYVPLQRRLEKGLPLEASKRVQLVLDRLGQPALTRERLRVLEAIDLLEHVRTSKAIALLEETERDALIPQIRFEAGQALQRIAQSPNEDVKGED